MVQFEIFYLGGEGVALFGTKMGGSAIWLEGWLLKILQKIYEKFKFGTNLKAGPITYFVKK